MRPRGVLALLTVLATFAGSLAAGGPVLHSAAPHARTQVAPQANPWRAPDLYDDEAEGVTSPTLLREVKPNYTSAAMRARIEGLVLLECIVELDGTVGAIRVRHSLDSVNGLDDEAIRVVRQWRFAPAMKDGKSVRSRILVEMSFALISAMRFRREWPSDYPRAPVDRKASSERFAQETIQTPKLNVDIKYPRDWAATKSTSAEQLIMVQKNSGRDARGCSISTREAPSMDLLVALPDAALAAYTKWVKQRVAGDAGGVEGVRVGQIDSARHLWLWTESSRRSVDVSGLAPEAAAQLRASFDGMREWTFVTSDNGQELSVSCYVFNPQGASKAELKEHLRSAATDFAEILQRMSIRER